MKNAKWIIIVCCLLVFGLWYGLRVLSWNNPQRCSEFLTQTTDYHQKIMKIIGQVAALKVTGSTLAEKKEYEQRREQALQELQGLTPPPELKKFQEKIQKGFEYTDKLSTAINENNQAQALEYAEKYQMTFREAFKELENVWKGQGCKSKFQETFPWFNKRK